MQQLRSKGKRTRHGSVSPMHLQLRWLPLSGLTLSLLSSCARAQNPPAEPALAPSAPLASVPAAPAAVPAAVPAARDLFSDTWAATDALGRSMPDAAEVGAPRPDKAVGIFYFLWQGTDPNWPLFDITRMLAANPQSPRWGGVPAFHWWGEPLFGYYLSYDPFVIRKHAQMLADAGVDVVVFDNTNGATYPQSYLPICKVFSEMRAQGIKTPAIAFFPSQKAADQIWADFYSKNLYPELWFRWKGKPFIQIKPEVNLPAPAQDFFSVRRSWAWSAGSWFGDGHDKWAWLDNSPQKPGWHDAPGKPEQISVSIAGHPTTSIGRSYHNGQQPPVDEQHLTPTMGQGLYFDEQWKRALAVGPEFVFVTGWNEWIAQRALAGGAGTFAGRPQQKGDSVFVDAFTQEFSRDAEPSKTSIGDNYFYQLAANIRRFKGARQVLAGTPGAIKIDGRFEDWKSVGPEFRDTLGDPARRDFAGWKGLRYSNATGRNDIVAAKVSLDKNYACFYARTAQPLSDPGGPNWMLLYIDADQDARTGWMGYDFVVNRSGVGLSSTTISANVGGKDEWGAPRPLKQAVSGNELEVAVPRWILGAGRSSFNFKWADNCFEKGDWSDFTLNGDAAPNDRFSYQFRSR